MTRLRLLPVALVTLVVASCAAAPRTANTDEGVPYPEGCAEFELSPKRCAAIVDAIGERLGVDPRTATEVRLLGDPGCGQDPNVLCMRTQAFVVRVRFLAATGPVEDAVFCGVGGQFLILCTDVPEVMIGTPTGSGFRDVPCWGEPPDGCATPLPTIDPVTALDARPLRVPVLEIPLDHEGPYELLLGTAVLPNGVLTEAGFALEPAVQDRFILAGGAMRLVVTGPDGAPIWNVYEQGWREGTLEVQVRLVFEVTSFEPGVVLAVRDLVVR